MKLLFDQNMSFKLCRSLADLFPDSNHVRLVELASASDRVVWEYAKANGFTLVSLDSDFAEMAALRGRRLGCAVVTSRRRASRDCFEAIAAPLPRSN
jgi:predicted nuclease of predicted toxin-antitoxin system